MNTQYISIKKLNSIYIPDVKVQEQNLNNPYVLSLNAEMMRLGFIMSKDLCTALHSLNDNDIQGFFKSTIKILKSLKGDDVKYKPMYPNFPKQVMDADYIELFLNAMLHYWSFGYWKPEYEVLERDFSIESAKFKIIDLCTDIQEITKVFTQMLASPVSLSSDDKEIVKWFLNYFKGGVIRFPDSGIPFKETLCLVAGELLEKQLDISPIIKTSTDVLRVMTHLSGGDISLSANTKFKSFSNKQRRTFLLLIENTISEEDISRHSKKWIRAFHSLHVGDYKNRYPKTFRIATKLRNGEKLYNFNSVIEQALIDPKKHNQLIEKLQGRPGEFARRLDHVLRISSKTDKAFAAFKNIAPKVSTRVLLQLKSHFEAREELRVAFPKGNIQAGKILPKLPPLDTDTKQFVYNECDIALTQRFNKLSKLGNVFIDPALKKCPVPMQQRAASTGLFTVARGTRLPLGDKNTLRLFIYWVGTDIDLSAALYDSSFNYMEHISYTNLRSNRYDACHSGDITRAPNGAAEFIDITTNEALKYGARYIVMNVYVYSGPTFIEHKKCYAGWMTKDQPNSGEIFDPKLVEQKIDLTSESKSAIPIVFDLETREAIWCDLSYPRGGFDNRYIPNNIENNRATIKEILQIITGTKNKPSLYNLFSLHTFARGKKVDREEDADIIFSLNEGITPFDINTISSEYLQ